MSATKKHSKNVGDISVFNAEGVIGGIYKLNCNANARVIECKNLNNITIKIEETNEIIKNKLLQFIERIYKT